MATATIAADSVAPSIEDAGAKEEKSDSWRLVEPQPVREDMVENAVKFLFHPKVKGSPVVYRRSFLERKGLSKEEIDEAFRRVPDPASDSSSPSTVPAAGTVGTANSPLQTGVQTVKPALQLSSVQGGTKSTSWKLLLLAVGVCAAAGAGAGVLTKKFLIPRLRKWIVDVVEEDDLRNGKEPVKPSPTDPVLEAATIAAAAATQAVAAMQEIAKSRIENHASMEQIVRAVEAQTRELKITVASMKDGLQNTEVINHQRRFTDSFHFSGGGREDYSRWGTNGARPIPVSERTSITAITARQSNFGVAPDPESTIVDS